MHSTDTVSCFDGHMGLYAMEPLVMRNIVAQIKAHKMPERPVGERQALSATQVPVPGQMQTVAVIPFHGPVSKKPGKFNEASAIEMRSLVRAMANDPTVSKIVLHIDSPGGAVGGIDDLAAAVREAKTKKPVVAYIEDLGASAAYWVASQATEIVANRSAFVGSLGVYGVIHDTSGAHEREGIKVHVISSGGVKGRGVAGVPVDEVTLAEERRLIQAITDLFKTNVQAGRGFSDEETTKLFDGRVHMAGEAKVMGLIDRVGTFEDCVMGTCDPEDKEEMKMETKTEQKAAVTAWTAAADHSFNTAVPNNSLAMVDMAAVTEAEYVSMAAELKQLGCALTEDSILRKLRAAGSMSEAMKVFGVLSNMKATAGATAPTAKNTLEKPVMAADRNVLSDQFAALVDKHRKAGKSLMEATLAAKNENPELHAAYIGSYTNLRTKKRGL